MNSIEISKKLTKIFKNHLNFKSIYLHEPDIIKKEINNLKKCILQRNVSSVGEYLHKFENEILKFTTF